MDFGTRLKLLRTTKGLTQLALAQKINLSKANVSKYEANIIEPNFETLLLLSETFEVSVDFLLGRRTIVPESEEEQILRLFETSDENIVLLSRKNGSRKKYTLSDAQTNIVENLLSEFSSSDTSRPASMVAYGGKENKSARKKKKTTI